MRKENIVTLALGAILVVVALVMTVALTREPAKPDAVPENKVSDSAVLRADSHVLGEKGSSGVTFVEFLDFECEACGAFYPVVEQLRKEYDGQVTFVARYFPLPGHENAVPAARAVEAAARQGEFEGMYSLMFQTQKTWGDKEGDKAPLFRTFADELGLDMAQFDSDVASTQVAERVLKDVRDGQALGVQGTPTFYVDGKPLQPQAPEDLKRAIDQALDS